jgi:hypothetical protein
VFFDTEECHTAHTREVVLEVAWNHRVLCLWHSDVDGLAAVKEKMLDGIAHFSREFEETNALSIV